MSQGFNEDKLAAAPQIRLQLKEGRQRGAAWMLRIRDTDTDQIFHLYVERRIGPRKAFSDYVEANGYHFDPIECYDFDEDLENQVLADRTVNWDKQLSVQTGPITSIVPFDGQGPNMPNPDPDDMVGRNRKK